MSSSRHAPNVDQPELSRRDIADYIHGLLRTVETLAQQFDMAPLSRAVGFAKDEAKVIRNSLTG